MGKESMKKGMKKITPLMEQYFSIKSKHPDAILLFRVGDFYETFGDDAVTTSKVLGIVLTKRNNGGVDIELAGFPYHSVDLYLPRLVKAGYRVAICEQLEKPSKEKKIVKRGITEIITPGLATDDKLLEYKKNNFLASISFGKRDQIGVAFLDLSTGEFIVHQGSLSNLDKLLQSFRPSEVIFEKSRQKFFEKRFFNEYYTFNIDEWVFQYDYCREKLLDHFDVVSLKGFGIEKLNLAQVAAGAVLHYLATTENNNLLHITSISRLQLDNYMWMDNFTIKNLELVRSHHLNGIPLLTILDSTITPMGARLMSKLVLLPLISIDLINQRLDFVEYFINNETLREEIENRLKEIGDIERLISKVPLGKINPRELKQLARALEELTPIKRYLGESKSNQLNLLGDKINPCIVLLDKINSEIIDSPPVNLNKGGVIKNNVDSELDDLRDIINNGKSLLIELQQREIERTNILNLKIGFNNVFGYYLEVTNKYKNHDLIPEEWVRKQTLTNSERYITPELKDLETKILTAEEKILNIELRIFEKLVLSINGYIEVIQKNSNIIAQLDVYISFANNAIRNDYVRPVINDSLVIDIKEGRHPVIEKNLPLGESFIANNVYLDSESQQIIMVTGPNMSGKSALLRQTGLICIMAQMGSFVPAKEARIGIVDKVFTRVGATDNISSGESTFMVEMNETANIMNNISSRSLVLLDEIGRGTSTFDGISIAWAITEFLHDNGLFKPKTLFATHYHELNELEEKFERIYNYNVATKEVGQKVVFLRKLEKGGSKHSFGIHVAKMAGLPNKILMRAGEILSELEKKSISSNGKTEIGDTLKQIPVNSVQLSIFDSVDETAGKLKEALSDIDIHSMTPIECMLKLNEMKKILEE